MLFLSFMYFSFFIFFINEMVSDKHKNKQSGEKNAESCLRPSRHFWIFFFIFSLSSHHFQFPPFFLRGFFYASTFFIKKLINRHWTRDNMMLKHIIYVSIFFSPLLSTGCCMCLLNNVWLCHVMYKEKKKSESEREWAKYESHKFLFPLESSHLAQREREREIYFFFSCFFFLVRAF
jgi:hypothetical protein